MLLQFPTPDTRIAEAKEKLRECILAASDCMDELIEEGNLSEKQSEEANEFDQKLLAVLTLLE